MNVAETGAYTHTTASVAALSRAGQLLGIFVSAASATPTIKVYDGTDNTGAVVAGVFTPVAGTFYRIPAKVGKGIFVEISGTVDCCVFTDV